MSFFRNIATAIIMASFIFINPCFSSWYVDVNLDKFFKENYKQTERMKEQGISYKDFIKKMRIYLEHGPEETVSDGINEIKVVTLNMTTFMEITDIRDVLHKLVDHEAKKARGRIFTARVKTSTKSEIPELPSAGSWSGLVRSNGIRREIIFNTDLLATVEGYVTRINFFHAKKRFSLRIKVDATAKDIRFLPSIISGDTKTNTTLVGRAVDIFASFEKRISKIDDKIERKISHLNFKIGDSRNKLKIDQNSFFKSAEGLRTLEKFEYKPKHTNFYYNMYENQNGKNDYKYYFQMKYGTKKVISLKVARFLNTEVRKYFSNFGKVVDLPRTSDYSTGYRSRGSRLPSGPGHRFQPETEARREGCRRRGGGSIRECDRIVDP